MDTCIIKRVSRRRKLEFKWLFLFMGVFIALLLSFPSVDAQPINVTPNVSITVTEDGCDSSGNCTVNVSIFVISINTTTTCPPTNISGYDPIFGAGRPIVQLCKTLLYQESTDFLKLNNNQTLYVPLLMSDNSPANETERIPIRGFLTLWDPENNIIINNQQMNLSNTSIFNYSIEDFLINKSGRYKASIQADNYVDFGYTEFYIDVTESGKPTNLGAYIFAIIMTVLIFCVLVWINFMLSEKQTDKVFNKIVDNFLKFQRDNTRSNLGYVILFGLVYGMTKLFFVYYYLLTLLLVRLSYDFVNLYNISSLVAIFNVLYTSLVVALPVLFMVFFLVIFDVVMLLINVLNQTMRGLYDGK